MTPLADLSNAELNRLCAKHVMQLTQYEHDWQWRDGNECAKCGQWCTEGDTVALNSPCPEPDDYADNLLTAWLVVETLRAEGWSLELRSYPTTIEYRAGFWIHHKHNDRKGFEQHHAMHLSATRAICEAALMAKGVVNYT